MILGAKKFVDKIRTQFLPDIPHMAIMDTAWHQTMPPYVYNYAVPYEWYEKYKIRRYGFHGTSFCMFPAELLFSWEKIHLNVIW